MKLLVSRLPSKGFASTLEIVDVQPLNYGQLLKYSSEKSTDPLSDLIWDMENLILTIPGWEELSSYDLFVLIAYRKMLTLSLRGKLTLTTGEEFDLSDVSFSDLDLEKVSKIIGIEVAGKTRKVSIKSMKKLYHTLLEFREDGVTSDKLAILGCYLGMSAREVISLTSDDIVICESLYPVIISHPVVEVKGGGEVILPGKASQLFRNLLELQKPDPSKIQYSS